GLKDTMHANFVLFMTDGEQNACSGDFEQAARDLRGANPPVLTYVVGFGTGVNVVQLDGLAEAGGTPRPGAAGGMDDPKYYKANDPTELLNAFQTIVGQIVSCTYTLASRPDDPSRIFVYVGAGTTAMQLPRDPTHTNGWDYDDATMSLTFYGATCNALRGGS